MAEMSIEQRRAIAVASARMRLKQKSQEAPEPSAADRLKALQGGIYRGVAGLAGLPMDTVENAYNLVKAGVGTVAAAAGRPDLAPDITTGTPLSSSWIADKLQSAGINTQNPRPDDPASKMLFTGGVVGGGSMVPGATVKNVALPAVGGAVAGSMSDNPLAVAVGAMAPGAAGSAAGRIKQGIAGNAAENLKTFKQAGVEPSVGDVTNSVFLDGLQNLAAKFPGGAGVMKKYSEKLQSGLGKNTSTSVSAEDAGRAIEQGIRGKGGFLERTKETWVSLDNAVASKVGGSSVSPQNTIKTLNDLTTPTPGAEKTTGALVNPKLAQMKENILADIQKSGSMPYEAIRQLRTRVGSMLDESLVSGVPAGELKKVYGALSKDLEAAAQKAGAGAEFARQNKFYAARIDRIESVLERVLGKNKQPEDIFKAVNPTDPNQANTLRATMRSLAPAERKVVTDAVINRLGRATPGRQNEVGDVFSSETFLTNWNKISPGAKAQLFPDSSMRENLDAIAKISANLRDGAKTQANPSGTAGSFAAYSIYASPIAAVAAGSVAPVVAAAGAAGSAYFGAKMMTNPRVVEWLANAPKVRPDRAAANLARLGVIYNESKDPELKQELAKFIQSQNQ